MRRLLTALLLAASGCATTSGTSAAPPPEKARASSGLPDFELSSVEGDRVRLSDYLGKSVVVLSFWDTWCEPCKTELPQLERIYSTHKEQGLVLLSISMDDPSTVAQVAPFVRRSGFHFPVLLDTETKAANLYNKVKSAPYTVIINRQGKVVSEKAGYEPGAEKALEEELVKLLAEPPAS